MAQDVLVVAARDGKVWPFHASGFPMIAIVGGGVAMWRRRTWSWRSTDHDDLDDIIDLGHTELATEGDLPDAARRLVTLVRWLKRDVGTDAAHDVVQRHLDDLAVHAERVDAVVRGSSAQPTAAVADPSVRFGPTQRLRDARPFARVRLVSSTGAEPAESSRGYASNSSRRSATPPTELTDVVNLRSRLRRWPARALKIVDNPRCQGWTLACL
jgi:hypothetical protein